MYNLKRIYYFFHPELVVIFQMVLSVCETWSLLKYHFCLLKKYLFPGLSEFESLSALGLLPLKPGPSRRFGTIRTWPWCFLTRDYEIKRFSSALTLYQRRLTKKKEKQIELLTPSFPSSLTWVLFTKAESVSHGLLSRKHVCLEQFRLGSGRFLLTDMNLRICKKGSLSFFPSYRFILRRFPIKVSLNHYSNHYHLPTEIKSKVPWLFLDICMVPRCLATCILF